jgi:type II secretory pathway component PulF
MTSFFTSNDRHQSQMLLVLSLLESGCTFDQIKRITECKQNSLHDLVLFYFGKFKDIYIHLRKYLSDVQCLQIKRMISNERTGFYQKFFMKLVYPGFICFFTFLSMVFFKLNLLNRIRSIFESTSNEQIFVYFDWILFSISIAYLTFLVLFIFGCVLLMHPSTRNYSYVYLYLKYKDNLLVVQNTGTFSKLLLQCINSGISTQNSLNVLGKLSDLPFVMYMANNCSNRLSEGASFLESISTIESDSSFKEFMQLGFYSNKITEQLSNYCTFNSNLLELKLKRIVSVFYAYAYLQFLIVSVLLYQVIQIPMIAIGSQL